MEAEQQLVTPGSLDLRWQDPEQPERDRDRFHVAINMDGNGRWALLRGRPREEGHVAGASAVRRTVESAPALGITTLTLYAFSSDNWRRPRGEVDNLMLLLQQYMDSECAHLTDRGVRFNVIGRRDRIADSLRRSIADVEERTSEGTVSTFGLRSTIRPAMRCWRRPAVSPEELAFDPCRASSDACMRPSTHRAERVTWICSSAPAENSD